MSLLLNALPDPDIALNELLLPENSVARTGEDQEEGANQNLHAVPASAFETPDTSIPIADGSATGEFLASWSPADSDDEEVVYFQDGASAHLDSFYDTPTATADTAAASTGAVVGEPSDYAFLGGKWGTQTYGTSGGVVTWSIADWGYLNQTGTTFFTGATVALSSFLNFDYVSVLHQAFAAWSVWANIDFVQVADGGGNFGQGTQGNIRIGGAYLDGDSNVLARAFGPVQGGSGRPQDYATSGDAIFDSGDSWTPSKFLAVATHEIGHALGLHHSSDVNSLMYPYYNPGITAPTADDIYGIRALYGARTVAGNIAVSDVTRNEGNSGQTIFTFTITRTAGTAAFGVYYATSDGTAVAGSDYTAVSGYLTFAAGENSKTVSVAVYGDVTKENHETFFFNLAGASNSGVIVDGLGQGIIANDDYDDYPATAATASNVEVGIRAFGEIETAGDRDWHRVQLVFNMTYQVNIRGTSQAGGTLGDPDVYLRSSAGASLGYFDDVIGQDPFITYTSLALGTAAYYLDIGGFSSGTGTYTIDLIARNALAKSQEFQGNLGSDILWRSDSGHLATWESMSGTYHAGQSFGLVGNDWKVQATADFNGDGRHDIVWRSSNGDIVTWDTISGSGHGGVSYGNVGNNWIIRGGGDFDADGRGDILFRATNGDVVVWSNLQANGAHGGASYGNVGLNWHIAAAGEFDSDGASDIVWRAASGEVVIWTDLAANGTHGGYSLGTVGTNWHIVGTGDFNVDGKSDILWRSDSGEVATWEKIDSNGVFGGQYFGVVGREWTIVDIGDYNGDGQSDILWQSNTGTLVTWENMYNNTHTGQTLGSVGLEWSVQDDNFEFV